MGALVAVVALAGDGEDSPGPRPAATIAPEPPAGSASTARGRSPSCGARSSSGRGPPARRSLRGLAERLRDELPRGRFEPVPGHPGLRNVVGRLPGRKPAIAIAAHYDTKRLPGFVGANDGAAGTAAVLELARALRRGRPPGGRAGDPLRPLRRRGGDRRHARRSSATGMRGSKAYARAHAGELRALILLDFVAGEGHADARASRRRTRGCGGGCGAAARGRSGAGAAFPPARAARSPTTTRHSWPGRPGDRPDRSGRTSAGTSAATT